jgi:hypothetical protein
MCLGDYYASEGKDVYLSNIMCGCTFEHNCRTTYVWLTDGVDVLPPAARAVLDTLVPNPTQPAFDAVVGVLCGWVRNQADSAVSALHCCANPSPAMPGCGLTKACARPTGGDLVAALFVR